MSSGGQRQLLSVWVLVLSCSSYWPLVKMSLSFSVSEWPALIWWTWLVKLCPILLIQHIPWAFKHFPADQSWLTCSEALTLPRCSDLSLGMFVGPEPSATYLTLSCEATGASGVFSEPSLCQNIPPLHTYHLTLCGCFLWGGRLSARGTQPSLGAAPLSTCNTFGFVILFPFSQRWIKRGRICVNLLRLSTRKLFTCFLSVRWELVPTVLLLVYAKLLAKLFSCDM